ncbi:hypothetical protein GCM10027613_11480 [Microlunatus endophyticus]
MMPPTAEPVVSRPKPTELMPSRFFDHSTSTDQAAAQVMLKARMTSANVRTAALAHTQRSPSPISRSTWVRCPSSLPDASPDTNSVSDPEAAIRATSSTDSSTQTTWTTNGQAAPTANRKAPTGGPTNWLQVRNPACSRWLPVPRSSLGTSIGNRVEVVVSAKTSATP